MQNCTLCPRQCGAQRGQIVGDGFCSAGTLPVVSRAAAHLWEEPCISGTKGSGTIFFSGCSLGCVFCQNEPISHRVFGQTLSVSALAELFARVEELGVHNVNLVNPTHFAPAVLEALALYKPNIPVVWNSSGYETVEVVQAAEGLVDVFLPDLKFFSVESSIQLAGVADYFQTAIAAIQAMCEQTGLPVYDEVGLMRRGTLVRHLVLPMRTGESIAILDAVASQLPSGTPVSLMRQYTPMGAANLSGLDRRLTPREYRRVREHMEALGLPGYLQQKDAADSTFTPVFMDEESTRLFPDAKS